MKFSCVNEVWKIDGLDCETHRLMPVDERRRDIPRVIAEEAYKEYSEQFGTQQSLERIEERGGFHISEISILLFERIKRLEKEFDGSP